MSGGFTPGPWHFRLNGASSPECHCIEVGPVEVSDTTPSQIAYLQSYVGHDYDDRDQTMANARLITAVPDLLAALRYARRFLRAEDHDVAFVDNAIAKATGAAP